MLTRDNRVEIFSRFRLTPFGVGIRSSSVGPRQVVHGRWEEAIQKALAKPLITSGAPYLLTMQRHGPTSKRAPAFSGALPTTCGNGSASHPRCHDEQVL
jgi:hypothetical protein